MGVKFAEYLKKFKPKGGTICLQLGNVAADNINARAAGTRDTLAGAKGTKKLTGQNGWKEIDGCPKAAGPSSRPRPTRRSPARSWRS